MARIIFFHFGASRTAISCDISPKPSATWDAFIQMKICIQPELLGLDSELMRDAATQS